MSSYQQYIDLFNAQRALIDEHAAPVLNAQREAAAEVLQRVGLSRPKDYTHVDPEALLAADYSLNLSRYAVPTDRSDLFTCAVPELSTTVHYLVNEQLVSHSREGDDGVFSGSLREFALRYPDIAARHYNRLAMHDEAPYDVRTQGTNVTAHRPLGEAALNTLLCQDGFVLYVPDGVVVERPIQLISLLRAVEDFMGCQRILIIMGEGAKASVIICDHSTQLRDCKLLSLQVTEIFCAPYSSLDFYELEEHHADCRRLSSVYVEQHEGSSAAVGQYALTAGQTRNRVFIDLLGHDADTHLYGLCIADRDQQVDNITYIRHRAPKCHSDELFKYVLDEEARGSFVGRILVQEGADKTDAHQTDRNLILTPQCHMVARPELEIYADDVKCSHGATTGQLDPVALFYMRTRGIPEAEARLLLMFAFMGDVIDGIRIDPLKDRLKHLVEKRFRGELTQCRTCAIKK